MLDRLQSFLFEDTRRNRIVWLALSLLFSLGFCILALRTAFSGPYIIQDDARQYVLMMHRLVDEQLFQNDLIYRYYDSITPAGFRALYQLSAWLGVLPLTLHKILPLPLAMITTVYAFYFCRRMFAAPLAGFVAAALLNENLWTKDDLASATPRAFFYPLFVPFLFYLNRRSWIPCLLFAALQALFFPPAALISLAVFTVVLFRSHIRETKTIAIAAGGFLVTGIILYMYSRQTSQFGPVITAAQAKLLPAFQWNGTQPFFFGSMWHYWIYGWHSGILPYGLRPPLIWSGLLLPFLIKAKTVETKGADVLWIVLACSLGLFLLAHGFLFHLYNPGRYMQHTVPVVMSLAAGISLATVLRKLFRWKSVFALLCAIAGAAVLLIQFQKTYTYGYGFKTYLRGRHTGLYEFLSGQPANIMVGSLSREADSLPAFAARSILIGREYALPYHLRYYHQIADRGSRLLKAQYSENLKDIQSLLIDYKIDFLLLDRDAFSVDYFSTNPWINVFQPAANEAKDAVAAKKQFALERLLKRCAVFEDPDLILLGGDCIGRGK